MPRRGAGDSTGKAKAMAKEGTCKAQGCEGQVHAKKYCARHFRLWKRDKMPKPRYKTCNQEACRKPQLRRGLCETHFAENFTKKAAA